ncbi:MAG: FeoB-associated Cys-rich membrane protein [Ruminococcus sp.]|nr:FeoB-associated Cys-rich membrane protein [Ruminococcus sp.]
MNPFDVLLIGIIAAALIVAVRKCIRDKKQGNGCNGNCLDCQHNCNKI